MADAERRGVLRRRNATAIAAATGLHRQTVSKHLRDLPTLAYKRSWRPVRRELLPLRLSVTARVLASYIAHRPPGPPGSYLPTLDDYADDLGWHRNRIRRALGRAIASGLVVEEPAGRRGSCVRKRRKAGTATVEKQARQPSKNRHGRSTKPGTVPLSTCTSPSMQSREAPNKALTAFLSQLPPMDGWESVLSEEVREALKPGSDPGSAFAVLTACGLYQRSKRSRWKLARTACARGWRTETLLGLVSAAFDPRRSEGSVRDPRALLRTWLEAPEVEERRRPLQVGLGVQVLLAARARQDEVDADWYQQIDALAALERPALEGLNRPQINARARALRTALGAALAQRPPDQESTRRALLELERCSSLPRLLAFARLHPELDCG